MARRDAAAPPAWTDRAAADDLERPFRRRAVLVRRLDDHIAAGSADVDAGAPERRRKPRRRRRTRRDEVPRQGIRRLTAEDPSLPPPAHPTAPSMLRSDSMMQARITMVSACRCAVVVASAPFHRADNGVSCEHGFAAGHVAQSEGRRPRGRWTRRARDQLRRPDVAGDRHAVHGRPYHSSETHPDRRRAHVLPVPGLAQPADRRSARCSRTGGARWTSRTRPCRRAHTDGRRPAADAAGRHQRRQHPALRNKGV